MLKLFINWNVPSWMILSGMISSWMMLVFNWLEARGHPRSYLHDLSQSSCWVISWSRSPLVWLWDPSMSWAIYMKCDDLWEAVFLYCVSLLISLFQFLSLNLSMFKSGKVCGWCLCVCHSSIFAVKDQILPRSNMSTGVIIHILTI